MEELKSQKIWVCWQYVIDKSKRKKGQSPLTARPLARMRNIATLG